MAIRAAGWRFVHSLCHTTLCRSRTRDWRGVCTIGSMLALGHLAAGADLYGHVQILFCLRTRRIRVCSIKGRAGIGKSSVAGLVAKHVHDRRWYRRGVHFCSVERMVAERQRQVVQRAAESTPHSETRPDISLRQAAISNALDDIHALVQSLSRYGRRFVGSDAALGSLTTLLCSMCEVTGLAKIRRHWLYSTDATRSWRPTSKTH